MNKDVTVNPNILIVIPAKNEEKHIRKCLQSICCQHLPTGTFAAIVVDNGSSDKTVEIAKEFHGVTVLQKTGGTISTVRNFGARHLNSTYIAFLDGDCEVPNNWLEESLALLQLPNVSCVGFNVCPPNNNASWVARTWHYMSSTAKHQGTCPVEWLSSFNLVIKRFYFEKAGGFDEDLETCEDVDLGVKLSRISKLVFSDKVCVAHHGTVNSVKEFLLKEIWRGKNSWQQYKKDSGKKEGAQSVYVPLFYLTAFILLPLTFIFPFGPLLLTLLCAIIIGLPFLFAVKKSVISVLNKKFPAMVLLAAVYLVARGLAVFKK